LTSVIDGNMVYGSTLDRAFHLRSFNGGLIWKQNFTEKIMNYLKIFKSMQIIGKLRISTVSNIGFLPFDTK
jgi:hypothetical protein